MKSLITLMSLPVLFLNLLGGIVGLIWLAILGDFRTIVLAIALAVVSKFIVSIMLAPGWLLAVFVKPLSEKKRFITLFILACLGLSYTYSIMALWCITTFKFFASRSADHAQFPFLLFAYAVATGVWSAMAKTDVAIDPNSKSLNATFAAQIGSLIMISISVIQNEVPDKSTLAIGFSIPMILMLGSELYFTYLETKQEISAIQSKAA